MCDKLAMWILLDKVEPYGETFACDEHLRAMTCDTTVEILPTLEHEDYLCCYIGENNVQTDPTSSHG